MASDAISFPCINPPNIQHIGFRGESSPGLSPSVGHRHTHSCRPSFPHKAFTTLTHQQQPSSLLLVRIYPSFSHFCFLPHTTKVHTTLNLGSFSCSLHFPFGEAGTRGRCGSPLPDRQPCRILRSVGGGWHHISIITNVLFCDHRHSHFLSFLFFYPSVCVCVCVCVCFGRCPLDGFV